MRTLVIGLTLILQAASSATIPKGSVSGLVIKGGSDIVQALANARVELLDSSSRQVVRTDSGGRFTLGGLLPGRYRIAVTKDGFIRQEYGQRIPNGPSSRIELGPSQQVSDLVFLMQPAPTITGWVRDEFGEVVPNVLVQASRRGYDARGKRTVIPMASTLSDDRGQYRLYWLDPGDYIVSAGSALQSGSIYLQTYFPGFDDPANAETVTLRVGKEVHGVDFKVVRGSPAVVSGSVIDTNKVFTAATITLQPPGDVASAIRYSGQALEAGRARGEFLIPDVTPGTYIVSASRVTAGQRYGGFTTITVRNGRFGAYNNVRIDIGPAGEVKGTFSGDGGIPANLSAARVSLTSVEPVLPSPTPVAVQSDGRFTVTGVLPGIYTVDVKDLPDDIYIKDADDVLDIAPGATPKPLEVVLGFQGAQIAGMVLDASGQPRFGSQIVLVPEGERRIRVNQYRLTTSAVDGAFSIRGIPPGDYKLFAWEAIEPYAWLNADFLRSYEVLGRRVRVTAGQKMSIQVQMIPDEP